MLRLSSSIIDIPKIGPTFQKFLQNLGVFTIKDLVYHLPKEYRYYTTSKKISTLQEGELVTIEGEVISIGNVFTKFGKKLTKGLVLVGDEKCELIWFNQTYLIKMIKPGDRLGLSGKIKIQGKKRQLLSPKYYHLDEASKNDFHSEIEVIYPETKGISSKFLSQKIQFVMQNAEFVETLPKEILEKHGFRNLKDSLNELHFPKNLPVEQKLKTRFAYEEIFYELIKVNKRKKFWKTKKKSFEMKDFSKNISILEKSLPFQLTISQQEAIKEILADLTAQEPMNRLLEGDVGTGKTIVAVFASYLTQLNSLKTLYLAPTEILAKQHFENFVKYLEPLGAKIVLKTASQKKKLSEQDFDICIGTHAILYDYQHIKNLGLVVIDEQHRFGVDQRSKLLGIYEYQTTPNLLTMTATPIPRTLALTLYGDLEISVLSQPPNLDKKITTYVTPPEKRLDMYQWIVQKNEPAFIVCPFVNESESEEFSQVKSAVKEFEILSQGVLKEKRVGLLHGQMKPKEKDEILTKFKNKELDIIVSTPVIEVGVDIPDASIIVIESAERYGLASLHQLRGRVGRGNKEGFCILIPSLPSSNSIKRLRYLESINNGLKLAEIDLKLRGEGDTTGKIQSGFKNFKFFDPTDSSLLETVKKDLDRNPDYLDLDIEGQILINN